MDESIQEDYRKWKDQMEDRAFMAKSNPLALAGALGDDENPVSQNSGIVESGEVKVRLSFKDSLTTIAQ
jgi:hypothetical protein